MDNLLKQDKKRYFFCQVHSNTVTKQEMNNKLFVHFICIILLQGKYFLLKLGCRNLIGLRNQVSSYKLETSRNANFYECSDSMQTLLNVSLFFKDNTGTAGFWIQNKIIFSAPIKFICWFGVYGFLFLLTHQRDYTRQSLKWIKFCTGSPIGISKIA